MWNICTLKASLPSCRDVHDSSVWDVTQMTVSRKTPIRLCGRSCSMRRDPPREPVLELVREWEPVPACRCARVKVLRSPQLRRCRMPGCLRSGSVLEVSCVCVCVCLRRVDWAGAASDTVMACKHSWKWPIRKLLQQQWTNRILKWYFTQKFKCCHSKPAWVSFLCWT